MVDIRPARSAADLEAAGTLFDAYAASLGVDLGYQDFATERRSLPGRYAPPFGELLMAWSAGAPVGCVGLRPIEPAGCCEMKRLFVAPAGRGKGVGRALVAAVIAAAQRIGHREMRLDTLPDMAAAAGLYRAAGFAEIAAYYPSPIGGTVFLARRL